jgi:hypothetical protein
LAWGKRIFFLCLFVTGIWSGTLTSGLFFEGRRDYEEMTSVQPTIEVMQLDVANTLIVLVDDVNQPMGRLLGAWLAVSNANQKSFYLTSLYPVKADSPLDLYLDSHSAQLVDLTDLSMIEHVPVIQAQNEAGWQSVIVIDENALGIIIDLLNNPTAESVGLAWVQSLPRSWEHPAEAQVEQDKMMRYITENLLSQGNGLTAPKLAQALLSSSHVLSSRSLPELKMSVESLNLADVHIIFSSVKSPP